MLSTLGRVKPLFDHARMLAASKRRDRSFVPAIMGLESRIALTVFVEPPETYNQQNPPYLTFNSDINAEIDGSFTVSSSAPNQGKIFDADSYLIKLNNTFKGNITVTLAVTGLPDKSLINTSPFGGTGGSIFVEGTDSSGNRITNTFGSDFDFNSNPVLVAVNAQTLFGSGIVLPISGLSIQIFVNGSYTKPVNSPTYKVVVSGESSVPNIALVSSPNPSVFGQSVTFTATVSPATSGLPTPTGTVTFLDGLTDIGTGTLNASGIATFTTSSLTVGDHLITADYGGDSNYSGSSGSVPETVKASTVDLTYLNWNTDRDGTAANAGHRGLDFSYTVNGTIPANMTIPIAFYWATGADPKDIISPAYSVGESVPDTININTTPGDHDYDTNEPFQDGNDPARWGTPPANAKDVLAIIDPKNLLGETEPPTVENRRVDFLPLPTSVDEVLDGAVTHKIKTMKFNGLSGPVMTAMFSPKNEDGSPMPLSEAEVYLGIDHFNWIQNVVHTPPTWQIVTLVNPDTSALISNNGLSPPEETLTYVNGNIYYQNAAGVIDRTKGTVQYYPVGSNFLDPIAESSSTSGLSEQYVRAYIIGSTAQPLVVLADKYYYYYNETDSTNPLDGGIYNFTFKNVMLFSDMPFIQNELNAYSNSEYIGFVTRLVGVNYDAATYIDYSKTDPSAAFKWTSDYTVTEKGIGIGGISSAWFGYVPPGFTPASGGYSDDYPVPVFTPLQPITFDPVLNQRTFLGAQLNLSVVAYDLQEGSTIIYSLSHDAPAGLRIDPSTGSLSFAPQKSGVYPITVNAIDEAGHTASTTFTIDVLQPTPATVIAGPNGNATTFSPFSRTGSFQDANGTVPFKATVNYGDGSPVLPLALNSDNTFNLEHIYGTPGNYTVTVSVSDANGLTGSSHFVVTVVQPSSGLGPVPDAFVTTLYREVLGRFPEASGLRFWASKLVARVRRTTIVTAFFTSPERRLLVRHDLAPKITPRRALADANRAARDAKSS